VAFPFPALRHPPSDATHANFGPTAIELRVAVGKMAIDSVLLEWAARVHTTSSTEADPDERGMVRDGAGIDRQHGRASLQSAGRIRRIPNVKKFGQ
jgi:hypothetical protein